jgi:hypothetical protein
MSEGEVGEDTENWLTRREIEKRKSAEMMKALSFEVSEDELG